MRITLLYVCVYDGIVIFIIVIMCTHPMYSCTDDGIHTPELEQQSHQSTPIFAIASVTYPRMRGGTGVLEQVGYFGHDDFNLGIVLHGSCRICGGRQCWHSHVASSHTTDLEGDTCEIPDEMWGWGHSAYNMNEEDFEKMFHRLVNDQKDNLRLRCKSRRPIPWHPQDYTEGQRNSRVSRSQGLSWCTQTADGQLILRDDLSEDQTSVAHEVEWYSANQGRGFLIHAAGVIPNVLVQSRKYQGDFMQFDGRDLGVFNWNNYILFTHEVLEEFLDLSCDNRMTHKGYIRAKISTWMRSITYGPKTLDVNASVRKIDLITRIRGQIITAKLQGNTEHLTCLLADLAQIQSSDTIPEKYNSHGPVQDGWDGAHDHVHAFSDILLEFLEKPSLPNIWTDAIFEFMSLIDIDYTDLFQCQCCTVQVRDDSAELDFDHPHHVHVVYDNSCKLLDFILLRCPALAQSLMPVIDALHYSGHSNCSPLFNQKLNLATRSLNAALNEQVYSIPLSTPTCMGITHMVND